MPEHASQLFARNVLALLELLVGEDGALKLDFDDEIVAGACIVREGEIVHAGAKAAVDARVERPRPAPPSASAAPGVATDALRSDADVDAPSGGAPQ